MYIEKSQQFAEKHTPDDQQPNTSRARAAYSEHYSSGDRHRPPRASNKYLKFNFKCRLCDAVFNIMWQIIK